ncbi:MAG TPA: TIGR03000 domain-containing protein [Gemmataceae bacterium]|nr:TIGR03000 domain-containing protein [Gemmataceae bacterium]
MMPRTSSVYALVLFCLFGFFGQANPAAAQLMSKWGHPVFTVGATPYDSTNVGHGNYPGGPGFIPGYGYYPGRGPDHYPWLDGPGTPFDRRKIVPVLPTVSEALPRTEELPAPAPVDAAVIVVKLPAEAELWFDGVRTAQGGSYRLFVTPPLPNGQEATYILRARWRLKGVELKRSEEVRVQAGTRSTVNFLTPDGWTGQKLEAEARR